MATPTTLPATFVAGNVLTAAEMNDLRGGFRILQFLSATTTTAQTSSSQTYADLTTMSLTITPQATTNKIFAAYMTVGEKTSGNANNSLGIRLLRDATTVATWTNCLFTGTALRLVGAVNCMYLDAPSSTSAITYKFQFANSQVAATEVSVQQANAPGTMILLEVSL